MSRDARDDVAAPTAPQPPGRSGRAARIRSAPLAALGAAVFAAAAPATAAPPILAPDEPATAVAGRTVVYLEATYQGHLSYRTDAGTDQAPVNVRRVCSGVVVNPDGHVVTANGCVRPDAPALLRDALYTLGQSLVGQRRLDPGRVDAFVAEALPNARFFGPRPGTAPSVTLFGQAGIAGQGRVAPEAAPATLLPTRSPGDGALALVKLERSGLPAIELLPTAPLDPGTTLVALGYGPRDDTKPGEYAVRASSVSVVGAKGPKRIRLDGRLGTEFRGGPVVDRQGRLVAVLDGDPATADAPVTDAVAALRVANLIDTAGVTNRVSKVDLAYRDALRDYFAGRFSIALGEFDAILRQAPTHGSAQVYRDRARERLTIDGDTTENSADWIRYLLSAAAGALLVAATGAVRPLARRVGVRTNRTGVRTDGDDNTGPGAGPQRRLHRPLTALLRRMRRT